MTVAVDAAGTAVDDPGASSPVSYTGLTIGSIGANSPALLVVVFVDTAGGPTNWSGLTRTCLWDTGGTSQSLALIGIVEDSSNVHTIEFWGIINPHTGLKTLQYTWTGVTTPNININAISLTGVTQVSTAAAFPTAHFTSSSNASSVGPASVAITSAAGNMAFMGFTANAFDNDPLTSSPSGAVEWSASNATNFCESYHANGAATVTYTGTTFGGTQSWACAGCDVVAAGAAAGCIKGSLALLGVGCGIWAAKKIEENPVLTRRGLIMPPRSTLTAR